MTAQSIVDRLLEADEFNAREYFAKTPAEEFDEGIEPLLQAARQLYARLQRSNVLKVAAERRKGSLVDPHIADIAKAVMELALEQHGSPSSHRIYMRIKRYGRYSI